MNAVPADPPLSGLARRELFREQAYIGGRWMPRSDASAGIEVVDPATGAVLGRVPDCGAADAERALLAAEAAMPAWSARPAGERAALLRRWYQLIVDHVDDLALILTLEQGKPLAEASGEIRYAAAYVEWFAEEARRIYGETIPGSASDRRFVVIRQPVGVVGAITPWNFPAAMVTRKVAPALAAGCAVVLKPSDLTPFSALALARLAEEAGLPPGLFSVVTGAAQPIGEVLTSHPVVRKFTFTGSTAVGKRLYAQCAGTVKRISLELGGNAPFLVFDDADIAKAIDGAMASKFRNAGQTCVCANRFIVQSGIHDAFVEALCRRVRDLRVGDGLTPDTTVGPLIDDRAVDRIDRLVEGARSRGARIRLGGTRTPASGSFFPPTVLTGVTPDMDIGKEEIFGPVAIVLRFDGEAEGIGLANATRAGLAAYLYTNDLSRSWRVSEALEYGMVGINTGAISSEVIPFGGIKESGIGREGSLHGIAEYVETKLLCTDVS